MRPKQARADHVGPGRRRAVGLFFLAPFVGEYLFGNTSIANVAGLFYMAPMYGGGALLIREVARRSGRGWPAMIWFAAAYALVEEGLIDMMLWNPHYGGSDIGATYAGTYVPWLGTSAGELQDVMVLHTVWSICVPIAIMEAFDADRARPWLGRKGLTITAVVFIVGSAVLCAGQIADSRFTASVAELAGTSVAIVVLLVAGWLAGRWRLPRSAAAAPTPRRVGALAFVATSLYWFVGPSEWALVVGRSVMIVVCVAIIVKWAHRQGWDGSHRLALAGGALLTYGWLGVVNAGVTNVAVAVVAIVLLARASRVRRRHTVVEAQ